MAECCSKTDKSKKEKEEQEKENDNTCRADDGGFIEVKNRRNAGATEKVKRLAYKPNTKPPKLGNNKQGNAKAKSSAKFVFQPKKKVVNGIQGNGRGNVQNVEKENNVKNSNDDTQIYSPKKACSVHNKILSALESTPNKYTVLKMYDVNEQG